MLFDEFNYRPKFNPLFRPLCMRFEEGDPDGGGGGNYQHWTDKYESTKGNEVLKRFATEEESHKGHLETKTKMSDPMRLPKSLDKATDEQRVEWNVGVGKLRGVPDKAEDYEHTRSNDLPDMVKIDDETMKEFRELAKTRDIPQSNFQGLVDFQLSMVAKQMAAYAETNEKTGKECVEKLQEELGKEKCKEALILVERALRSKLNKDWQTVKAEDDEVWQKFKTTVYATGVGNNKVVMDLLIVAANQLESTGKLLPGTHSKAGSKFSEEGTDGMSEEEIQREIFPESKKMLD